MEYFAEGRAELKALATKGTCDRPPFTFRSGATYTGGWKDNRRHGRGAMRWKGKASHAGEWRDDRAHGRGRFDDARGTSYTGKWSGSALRKA